MIFSINIGCECGNSSSVKFGKLKSYESVLLSDGINSNKCFTAKQKQPDEIIIICECGKELKLSL